jgi:hypothetical protein
MFCWSLPFICQNSLETQFFHNSGNYLFSFYYFSREQGKKSNLSFFFFSIEGEGVSYVLALTCSLKLTYYS